MIPIAKPLINDEEIEEVVKVLKSGIIAQGPKVAEFEEKFSSYITSKDAVAVSSGTTALHLAMLAAGVGEGDEVITTPFSFAATGNCVLFTGARPVFVDIDPKTYNLNPDKISGAINDNTRAILPVHLYGQSAEMDKIKHIAAKNDLKVIEDAAQAHGALYKGKMAGSWGDMACFSFYPTKNMTSSEGGMITTMDTESADLARIMRAHGERERYNHEILGYNFRMTDIAAAIGIVQLAKLEYFNQKRIENANYLTEHVKEMKGILPPYESPEVQHVYHQYTIRVLEGKRDQFMHYLNREGIGTGIHYPKPIYQQKVYRDLGYRDVCLEAEKAAKEVLSIPVHPGLDFEDLERIVITLQSASDKYFD